MITNDKNTENFCAVDGFCKEFDKEMDKKSLMSQNGKPRRYRKAPRLSIVRSIRYDAELFS